MLYTMLNLGCPERTQIVFRCDLAEWICLDRDQVCDGRAQCVNGMDESAEICGGMHIINYCYSANIHLNGNQFHSTNLLYYNTTLEV